MQTKRRSRRGSSRYIYSARTANFPDVNSVVTVSFSGGARASFCVPMRVVRDFIYPFASVLNYFESRVSDNRASQTSYVNDGGKEKSFTTEEGFSDFEYDILKNLRSNLVKDITRKVALAQSDSESSSPEENDRELDLQVEKQVMEASPDKASSFYSAGDEGFDDLSCSVNGREDCLASPEQSKVVLQMSHALFEYLTHQCYEIKELILFPEVLYDQNISKLMTKLKKVYDTYCPPDFPADKKNELRIQVALEVMTLLNLKDISSQSPEGSFVSDKIFSISEFVSDILDQFFSCVLEENNNSFDDFKDSLTLKSSAVSSTPDVNKKHESDDDKPEEGEELEVTSFHRDVINKGGSQSFWITISKCDVPKSPSVQRKVINVDDIPLKPPPDLEKSLVNKTKLSPIPEEARRALKFDEESDEEADVFAGGDNTYVSFDDPEINVVVAENALFNRTRTVNASSYVAKSSVQFRRTDKSDDSEGDWMGFDTAKF